MQLQTQAARGTEDATAAEEIATLWRDLQDAHLRLATPESEPRSFASNGAIGPATRVTLRDASGSLSRLKCDDPSRLVCTSLEDYIVGNGALKVPANQWLEGDPVLNMWSQLRAGFEAEFEKRTLVAELYEVMATRCKHRDETILDYVQEIKSLRRQASMAERDDVTYIVKVVTDDDLVRSDRTFENLDDRLEDAEELMRKRDKEFQGASMHKGKTVTSKL